MNDHLHVIKDQLCISTIYTTSRSLCNSSSKAWRQFHPQYDRWPRALLLKLCIFSLYSEPRVCMYLLYRVFIPFQEVVKMWSIHVTACYGVRFFGSRFVGKTPFCVVDIRRVIILRNLVTLLLSVFGISLFKLVSLYELLRRKEVTRPICAAREIYDPKVARAATGLFVYFLNTILLCYTASFN